MKAAAEPNSSVDMSVDKSVDRTSDSLFDLTDRGLEHHHERNKREMPRLAMELMRSGISYIVASRIANAVLLDYEVVTAEDTSQFVTPSKLYKETLKVGGQLNSEAMKQFRAQPPSFLGFDGKIMAVKSFKLDDRGVKHPVQNKRDQIGEK